MAGEVVSTGYAVTASDLGHICGFALLVTAVIILFSWSLTLRDQVWRAQEDIMQLRLELCARGWRGPPPGGAPECDLSRPTPEQPPPSPLARTAEPAAPPPSPRIPALPRVPSPPLRETGEAPLVLPSIPPGRPPEPFTGELPGLELAPSSVRRAVLPPPPPTRPEGLPRADDAAPRSGSRVALDGAETAILTQEQLAAALAVEGGDEDEEETHVFARGELPAIDGTEEPGPRTLPSEPAPSPVSGRITRPSPLP